MVATAAAARGAQGREYVKYSGKTGECSVPRRSFHVKRSQGPIHNILPAPPGAEMPLSSAYITMVGNRWYANLSPQFENDKRVQGPIDFNVPGALKSDGFWMLFARRVSSCISSYELIKMRG